jgi:hypothetical protein
MSTDNMSGNIDPEKYLALLLVHPALMALMLAMFMQEMLWSATKDMGHLIFLTLNASVAGFILRASLRWLDSCPTHFRFIFVSTYSIASTFLVLRYFKDVLKLGLGDFTHILWGVLLTALLFAPLLYSGKDASSLSGEDMSQLQSPTSRIFASV